MSKPNHSLTTALTEAELRIIIADATRLKNRTVRYVLLSLSGGMVKSEPLVKRL